MTDVLPGSADWTLIRAFVEVVRSGTLSAASRNLGQTQPTVGRQIRRLEELCGEPLFMRRGRELAPTDRARTLFEAAEHIEQEVTALSRAFSTAGRGAGLVRLTTSEILATEVLPRLLPDILAGDPGLEIELVTSNRLENLMRRDADIAIRFAPPSQPELIAAKLGEIDFGLYAHRDLVAALGAPAGIEDLAAWPWISSGDGSEVFTAFRDKGLVIDPARLRLRADSFSMRLRAVEAGLGVGAISHWSTAHRPHLRRVLPQVTVLSLQAWICAHDDLRRSPRLRYVFDALRDRLRELLANEARPRPDDA